MTERPVQVSQ